MPINASELTAQEQITAVYVAYYDRAPDPAGLEFWVDQLEGGRSLEQIATDFSSAAETVQKYPYFEVPDTASSDAFINAVYGNLFGRPADSDGLDFWTDQLESGSTSVGEIILAILEGAQDEASGGFPDSETITNKIEVGLDWAETAANEGVGTPSNLIAEDVDGDLVVHDQDAFDSAGSVLDDVTGDQTTVDDAKADTDAFFGGNAGQTFTLTEGSDQIPGLVGSNGTTDNSGDDLILAGTSNVGSVVQNTLGSGDNLNGGDGFDILRTIDDAGVTLTPTTASVERFELQATNGSSTMNMINTSGVEEAWNYRSTSDVNYTNIQGAVIAGIFDSNTRNELTYENGVDLGGVVNMAVDGAGVDTDLATIRINSDDAANVTDLNVSTGAADSYLDIDIDSAPGAGTPAALENLTISGVGGLLLREENTQGETNTITTVDATGLEGFLDLNLGNNGEDIDFDGGDGDTTLVTGGGDSMIDTGAGDDNVTVGNGDNVINTNDGDDVVDITAGGDESVMLGDGDDVLLAGSTLFDDDAIEAGDGIDTLVVDVAHAATFTANGDVDAVVNGFEVLDLDGTVADGDTHTVNLDNIDDIDYVITDGTAAGTAVAEQQIYDFDGTGAYGGQVTIEGVVIDLPANLSDGDVANFILANAGSDIQAAYAANHPGETIDSITQVNSDQLQFDFALLSGDVSPVNIVPFTGSVSAGATFGSTTTASAGADAVNEVQTIDVDFPPAVNGTLNVNLDTNAYTSGTIGVALVGGESTAQTAGRIITAINNAATNVTASLSGTSTVELTYDALAIGANADVSQVTTSGYFGGPFSSSSTSTQGVAAAAETQTVQITGGTDTDGGFIDVGNSSIELGPNLSIDDIGFAILGELPTILAENPDLAAVNYDTATDTLTFTGTLAAGDIGLINVSNTVGNFPDVLNTTQSNTGTTIPGVDGSTGGVLNVEYVAPGGTLELGGANLGTTNVNIDGVGGSDDEFDIVLATGDAHTGVVDIAGIENLNVTTEVDGVQSALNINAVDLVNLDVSGTSGVQFFGSNGLANLETVNGADLDIEVDEGGIFVQTFNNDGTNFTGSAGQDHFIGDVGDDVMNGGTGDDILLGGDGADVLNGGDGDDEITGGLGADELTGGAGKDTFFYSSAAESRGSEVDTITDFVSETDKIDLSDFNSGSGFASGDYLGEVNSLAAANSAFNNVAGEVVFDTSTNEVLVDVDGSGSIDSNDLVIELTGVTDLVADDFTFA